MRYVCERVCVRVCVRDYICVRDMCARVIYVCVICVSVYVCMSNRTNNTKCICI